MWGRSWRALCPFTKSSWYRIFDECNWSDESQRRGPPSFIYLLRERELYVVNSRI
ncbi:uncharacterized protein G2W53_019942 [Senna tora]|uniref:Uncharacterized protein n=1 Tax=Senna tora TaxID=362788 RepID=A0A834TUI9_9FABA|nr:uncharacterized protein G2W53_019942 [Senna tora]